MRTSEIIRSRRQALGLSQADLAASVGLEVRQIGRYESGASLPSLQAGRAIAERLGITLDELAGGGENLSGTWWSCWQGLDSAELAVEVNLLHRGQRLEMTSRSPGEPAEAEPRNGDPVRSPSGQTRISGELRVLPDAMLGWYVLEGHSSSKGTLTLEQCDQGFVGVWLTVNLTDGFRDGYIALARSREAAHHIVAEYLQRGRTRHDRTTSRDDSSN